jgi:hypothetical protein
MRIVADLNFPPAQPENMYVKGQAISKPYQNLPITPGTKVTLHYIPTCCLLEVGCVNSELYLQ